MSEDSTNRRLALKIAYDGSAYVGWQNQPNGPSIQARLEEALTIALGEPAPVTGSGRTDAGVHARGQVVHIHLSARMYDRLVRPGVVDLDRLQASLNGLLPADIRVLDAALTPASFHARFDARWRTYHYHVSFLPSPLDRQTRVYWRAAPDVDQMKRAAAALMGEHNFSSFCRTQSETVNRVCVVSHVDWVAESGAGHWRFEITGNRFLHGMVRAIVGTLWQIGKDTWQGGTIPEILAGEDRRLAGPAAPPYGLVLHRVEYEQDPFG